MGEHNPDRNALSGRAAGRRTFLGAVLGAGGTAALSGCVAGRVADPRPVGHTSAHTSETPGSAPRFVDLTHPLTSSFAIGTPPRVSHEAVEGSGSAHGMRLNRFSLVEHTGTHIDAPSHFGSDRADLAHLPLEDLIGPLAVMDIRTQAMASVNFAVRPDHILDWEARHGRLPDGGCLALWSGFDAPGFMERIASGAGRPEMGMPGFAPETAAWLLENRALKGVAVDSMTLDSGAFTPEYPFHNAWLAGSRWGVEALANLGSVPATGATLIVGAAPIEGATGFPIRAIAML